MKKTRFHLWVLHFQHLTHTSSSKPVPLLEKPRGLAFSQMSSFSMSPQVYGQEGAGRQSSW